jgi:ornithine cyclodeaminase
VYIVPEALVPSLVSRAEALAALEDVFVSTSSGTARNFPVVREAIGHRDALYGFKSGVNIQAGLLGVKAGGYWPHNSSKALANHQSSVLLFDPDTGRLSAIIGGNYLTAVRTAAASAASIAHLARETSRCLGVLGAGGQAEHQIRAAVAVRPFESVLIWSRTPERVQSLIDRLADLNLSVSAAPRETVVRRADVLITVTSSFSSLVDADWVRPGTHLACMGTDTKGKQEVDAILVSRARVFTDEVEQAVSIGEAQHAVAEGLMSRSAITPLGHVIAGGVGRHDDSDITLYDGTGVGLQDLAVAHLAMRTAIDRGVCVTLAT